MSEATGADAQSRQSGPGQGGCLVVGIGASAGGIAALRQFFGRVTAGSGLTFVVILHLSPQHESNLAALLQTHTKIPVTQVNETVRVQPDHVYVMPPNKYLVMEDGDIKLTDPERARGGHSSIDLFFRTLADAYGKDAVAIVLSGTGADGTLGLRRVKEHGGFAIAQDPGEAEYDSMPLSAIETGLVDLVLPVAEMPDRLRALGAGPQRLPLPSGDEEEEKRVPEADLAEVRKVLTLLRQRTGHDFTQYKRPTLLRRIARRLQVHGLPEINAYLNFLRDHPEEVPALLRDLLITVTNFFRDHDAFESLYRQVVPKLFAGKGPNDQVRVWVVGCATGEEAYSIAMGLCEYAARLSEAPRIQIFATDIDDKAIAQARECRYPHTIALDVSPERLRQFFTEEGDHYRVKKDVRELILFAPHNVLRDPPFSKLDLVSCRNLLIYLNREMQERTLATFHFALAPGGYLFLGASETAEGIPALFVPLDKKHRIYARRATIGPVEPLPNMPRLAGWNMEAAQIQEGGSVKPATYGVLHQKVVERLAPPSVLVNEEYDIVHLSEHAGRFLHFAGGEPSRNLLNVVHPGIRLDLQAILLAAKARAGDPQTAGQSRRVRFEIEGKPCVVDVTVRRVAEAPAAAQGFFLVIFDETSAAAAKAAPPQSAADGAGPEVAAQLEEELRRTRDQLNLTVEQYETTTEELKASNEELQAMNEELRSTGEELETSKEELQSLNEELTTVNQELREKIEELGRVNSDLQNLLSSPDIATIFLDRELQIKRYTERAKDLFNITAADIRRPLEHFTHNLDYQSLAEDVNAVLKTLQSKEREVHANDGRWYLARLLPYRTMDDKIEGVVLNFVDITMHRQAEELRRQAAALQEQSQILGLANVFIQGLDDRIVLWNTGCERLYGYSREEALGRVSYELLASEFPQPLSELKSQLFATGLWDGELVQVTRGGERVAVASRWVLHRNEEGEPSAILEVNHDITARKRTEEELRQADRRKDQFLATLAHELRNPLAVMLGSLELLSEAEGDAEAIQVALRTMERQFAHLMRLVDDLLDIERLARGKIALRKERITLGSVVDAALESGRALLAAHGHTLTTSVPGAAAFIIADRARLAQVLTNLLHNAAKFTPPGGRIELSGAVEDGQAVLRVRDSGQGISEEVLPHIFDYFVQEEPLSEAHRRGLGVGLGLAHQLIELHGGTIEASSAGRGKGSEFTIHVPLAVEQKAPPQAAVAEDGGEANAPVAARTVLVIDDERDIADLTAGLLRRSGHQVWAAYNGKAGLEIALQQRPSVALVDIAMPDMDGYEVARRLRQSLPGILLIAITGLVQESDRVRAREAGFDYHLAKPASISQIEELITKSPERRDGRK